MPPEETSKTDRASLAPVVSDSDDVATSQPPPSSNISIATLNPTLQTSPSNSTHKRNISAEQSPTSKRPRLQTVVTSLPEKPKEPDNSPRAKNVPHPISTSPFKTSPKPSNVSSPSARRRSPSIKGNHQKIDPSNDNGDTDEDKPLDLAKISSYEYEQVAKLNPVQLRRYEQYRRSDLKNAKVRRLIQSINPSFKPTDPYIIAVKGLAKLFVGDVVETALHVKKIVGDKGALQPKHIREAYRRLRRTGAVPSVADNNNVLH